MATGGLDLARRGDYSALIRIEADGPRRHVTHALRLERTAYAEQIGSLAPALGDLDRLGVDATGVGDPVVEMIRAALPQVTLVPVVITGGTVARLGDDGRWSVPKAALVGAIREAMGLGYLTVSPQAPGRDDLRSELAAFAATQSGRSTRIEASAGHDDLVLALAIALWAAGVGRLTSP
jgi:hypothetical protein